MTGVQCAIVVPERVADMYALRHGGIPMATDDGRPCLDAEALLRDSAWPHVVCYQAAIGMNSYHLEELANRLHVMAELCKVFNRLATGQTQPHDKDTDRLDRHVKKLLEWPDDKERCTDHYNDDGYCELCHRIWEECSGADSGSSSGMHDSYLFVSVTIQAMAKRDRSLKLKLAKEALTLAQAKVKALTVEAQAREADEALTGERSGE